MAIWGSLIGRWKRVKIRLYGKRIGEKNPLLDGDAGGSREPPLLTLAGVPPGTARGPPAVPRPGTAAGLWHLCLFLPPLWSGSPQRDLVNKSIGLKFL